MWVTKCSGCGKMTPANQCPQLRIIPLCKPCWLKSKKMIDEINITPQTYIDMNKEFEEDGTPFRIVIPTQEQIDEHRSRPPAHYKTPPAVDMVQEMWDAIGGRPNEV